MTTLSLSYRLSNPLTQAFAALAKDVQDLLLANKPSLEIFEPHGLSLTLEPAWHNAGLRQGDHVLKHWILRINPDTSVVQVPKPVPMKTVPAAFAVYDAKYERVAKCDKPKPEKGKPCLKLVKT